MKKQRGKEINNVNFNIGIWLWALRSLNSCLFCINFNFKEFYFKEKNLQKLNTTVLVRNDILSFWQLFE